MLLRGRVDHIDGATGELLHRYTTVHEPGGVLPIACKTRRASQCPPCAENYRADTYQLPGPAGVACRSGTAKVKITTSEVSTVPGESRAGYQDACFRKRTRPARPPSK